MTENGNVAKVDTQYRVGDSMLRFEALKLAIQTHGHKGSEQTVLQVAGAYFRFLSE